MKPFWKNCLLSRDRNWFSLLKFFLFFIIILPTSTIAQGRGDDDDDDYDYGDGGKNKKPKIEDQRPLSVNAGESITISLLDLEVEDKDDWFYPWGFTLQVYDGENYTRQGETVTPPSSFEGELRVPVTVHDGRDYSNVYNLKITVIGPNDPPVITGQQSISVNEDASIRIRANNLVIEDPDDNNFSVIIHSGSNYAVAEDQITPSANYTGTLTVPVQVYDGEASSNLYNVLVTVNSINDAPRITGQQSLNTTNAAPVLIQLSHLVVEDVDNNYPTDFRLNVRNGNNYQLTDDNQVLPDADFTGNLRVNVRVNDGEANSPNFELVVSVSEGNDVPVITNQSPVIINEDEQFTIELKHLTVFDRDDNFPNGFSLVVSPGENYSLDGNTVIPTPDFNGNIVVPVRVNDGENTSSDFNFQITVRPVNDPPVITLNSADSLILTPGGGAAVIFPEVTIVDPDNDSLTLAEVSFSSETYTPGSDLIYFQETEKISGVFDSQRGVLALIGNGSAAEYADALKSITVEFLSTDGATSAKTISALVSDGRSNSNRIERKVIFGESSVVLLDIPNGFTPNGDQVNDTWQIQPLQENEIFNYALVRVYTRRGVLVYESYGISGAWDGTYKGSLLPADVYFYTIDFKTETSSTEIEEVKGVVTILR